MANVIEELAVKLGIDADFGAFERAEKSLNGLRVGLGAIAAIGAAVGTALAAIVETTARTAVEAFRTSQKIGTTAEAYQELKYAGDLVGVSSEEIITSLGRLARSAFEAAHGGGQAAFAYRQLGVGVYKAEGGLKTSDELLEDVASRFATMPDGIRKTALAQQLFGRGGKALIPLLNKGRDGIDELRQEAHKYGVVLDQETIEASLRWEEQQKHLKAAVLGLRNALGSAFIKRVTDVTDKIADWIASNRELISSGIMSFLDGVVALLKPIAIALDELFVKTGAWKAMLIAVGVIFATANLWLIFLGAILFAIEDIYGFMQGKDSLIGRMFPPDALEKVRSFLNKASEVAHFLFGGGMGEAISGGLDKIRGAEALQAAGVPTIVQKAAVEPQGFMQKAFGVPAYQQSENYRSQGGSTINAPITINAAVGMDPKQVAYRTIEALEEYDQRKQREAYGTVAR